MRLRNIYFQPFNGSTLSSVSGKLLAGVTACFLFTLLLAKPATAQTSVSRTTSILAGASPFQDSLWTFDISDYSVRTRIGPTLPGFTITGMNGLATHPVTGVHYIILKVSGVSGRVLATIDLQTGVCTQIGNLGDNFASLAFNANGTLFGVTGDGASSPSTMYRINLSNASKTLFRSLGSFGGPSGASRDGEVIAYCNDNNFFYHFSGNSNTTLERLDTTGTDVLDTIAFYSSSHGGETFGALYLGNGNILVSNISSEFRIWDTLGNIGSTVATGLPDDIRGIVRQTITSTIAAGGPTTICSGTSVILTVTGASGGYQWYQNGSPLLGATSSTYSASAAGIYNCIYTDINGFTDSTASGIPVIVKPTPSLSGSTTMPTICNNTLFSYTATSLTPGTSFAWTRAFVTGITNLAASGGATINETLVNTTADPIVVTYSFALIADGCTNTQLVTLAVNPTPTLFPPPSLVPSFCSGGTFTFTQNSLTLGTTYSWYRAAITGISNPAATGTGNINEVLVNTSPNPITVIYTDTLDINGCKNVETLSVIVKPIPVLTSTLTPTSICDNATFDYNPTSATAGTSYTWERPVLATIGNAYGSGADTINETVDNISDNPVTVTYAVTLTANGCSNTQNVNVLVNPTPTLNTTLTPAAKCDSTHFAYYPSSNTTSAGFAWTRLPIADITPTTASGTDTISEWLKNASAGPIAVTYVYTLTIGGCSNTQNVVVTINPKPKLSNTPIPATPICDSTLFSFVPTSTTLGTAYEWRRVYVEGISALADSGIGNPNEILDNTTNTTLTVVYVYTLTANGCSNVQIVPVIVRPTPTLSSKLADSACSAMPYVYLATTNTIPASSVSYEWSRNPVAGISPLSGLGTGNVNETLINPTLGNIAVTYVYTLSVGTPGSICTNKQNVSVLVRPAATAPVIATMSPAALCEGTMYQNFGTATLPPTGVNYTWSAANASIQATGTDGQYALVNFTSPGTATVMVTATIGATGCIGSASYTVNVASATSQKPYVIYNSGKFVCLQNDVKSYQWGYDDANTLDSTILKGETGQSYFNLTATTTFVSRHYWVITTTTNGCIQKTYYDTPPGGKIVSDDNTGFAEMKVFPNPASDNITVAIKTTATGNIAIELVNIMGQVVNTVNTTNHNSSLNIGSLPAGIYMVNSYLEGNKIGTAKFVKN